MKTKFINNKNIRNYLNLPSMALLIIALFVLSTNIYALKEKKSYNYSLEVVYSTMVRYLIVDESAEITQKDMEGAYIKFNSKKNGISGIIEIIKVDTKKTKMIINFEGAHYKLILFLKNFDKKIIDEQVNLNK